MLTEVEKIAAELDISLSEVDEESTFEEKSKQRDTECLDGCNAVGSTVLFFQHGL